jgi:hypothetical protein
LKPDLDLLYIRRRALSICNTEVQDIFPCTPLQEGLLSLTSRRNSDYIARFVIELRPEVQAVRFTTAWDKVIESLPSLRTRFIYLPESGILQVITNEKNTWYHQSDLDRYVEEDQLRTFEFGNPFSRTGLVKDERTNKNFFVWTIHHALYDAWSIRLLWERIQQAYEGNPILPSTSFQSFIRYLKNASKASTNAFWRQQFVGFETSPFPSLPSPVYHPLADRQLR